MQTRRFTQFPSLALALLYIMLVGSAKGTKEKVESPLLPGTEELDDSPTAVNFS